MIFFYRIWFKGALAMRLDQRGKMMAVSATVLLTVAMAGCSLNREQSDSIKEGLEENMDRPVEISMMAIQYDTQPPKELIQSLIEEKTNTRLSFTWVPDNVYTDKMMAAVASGTLPKIVQVKSLDMKSTSIVNGIRSDMFWEIGPYLNEYPNIRKYMNNEILNQSMYFGKVYGLYYEVDVSRQGIQYRKDWLDRLGLAKPRTIDDLYKVLRAFALNDPDGNGKHDTYGLIDRNDLVYGAFKNLSSYFGTPNNWGVIDGKLVPAFTTQEYMDTMNFMRKLYDEGLMNRDFTVTSKLQQEEQFVRGKAGVMIGNLFAPTNRDKMIKLDPTVELDIINRIEGPKGSRIWATSGIASIYLFPKSSIKNEAELKRILQFFNDLLSKEIHDLVNYGVEGRHYKRLNADTIELIPEARELKVSEVNGYMNTLRVFNIQYSKLNQTDPLQVKVDRLIADNQTIAVFDPAAPYISPTQAEKGTELQKMITDATFKYIIGSMNASDFFEEVERWKTSGGNQIIEELNHEYSLGR
jgi:putative aldouronate transport system substrate-binding protein